MSRADLGRLRVEAAALAAEIRPLLDKPERGYRHYRRRARSIGTALANFLENRRRAADKREDLLPLYFIWTTLRPCNFRCDYCDDHRGRRYPELPRAGVLDTAQGKRLLRVMRTRAPSVYFAGGEPTLRNDLPELVRSARDLDFYPIAINTNASLLHRQLRRPAWRTLLADVDVLIVSLDALDRELLSNMWRYPRPEDVIRNLFLLCELSPELGVRLMVNTVIQPGLIGEARAVLDLACELGIGFCPVPRNVGPRIDPAVLSDPDYPDLVRTILERKRAGYSIVGTYEMNRRLLTAHRLSCRNTLKPHIDHDGRLSWPCKASQNVEPTMIDVLAFDSVDELYAAACRLRDPTGFHGPGPDQCGADCNWAQNYTTDEYARGLGAPLSLVSAVRSFVAG